MFQSRPCHAKWIMMKVPKEIQMVRTVHVLKLSKLLGPQKNRKTQDPKNYISSIFVLKKICHLHFFVSYLFFYFIFSTTYYFTICEGIPKNAPITSMSRKMDNKCECEHKRSSLVRIDCGDIHGATVHLWVD